MDTAKAAIEWKLKLSKAIPYMSDVIMTTTLVLKKDGFCGTDGKTIFISEKTINAEGPGSGLFIFAHEVLHVGLRHMTRFRALKGQHKEKALHNILCDCKINDLLLEGRLFETPYKTKENIRKNRIVKETIEKQLNVFLKPGWKSALGNTKYEDVDTAFSILRNYLKKSKNNSEGGKNEEDEQNKPSPERGVYEDPSFGDDYTEKTDEEIKRKIAGGLASAKLRGDKTDDLLAELEGMWFKQNVNWRKLISNSIRTRLRQGRTWNKLHRKSFL